MIGMLSKDVLQEAARLCYASAYQQSESECGMPESHWEDIPEPDYEKVIPVVTYYLGMVAHAWQYDVGLVLYHGDLDPNARSADEVGTALFYLLEGCQGSGYSLDDEYPDLLVTSASVLNPSSGLFLDTPFCEEMCEFREIAYQDLQDRLNLAGFAPDIGSWPFSPSRRVVFVARMDTGDIVGGRGYVEGCLNTRLGWRVVVKVDNDCPDRAGEFVAVNPGDIL